MAILNNNPLVGASGNQGGYNISNSLRFRSSASAKLTRTPASSSNRKTWTWSGWVKLGAAITSGNGGIFGVTGSGDSELFSFRFESNTIKVAGNFTLWLQTTQVFRDPSAWYHIVLSVDTTQTTSSNRFKLYINGNQVTALSTANYPSQNADLGINRAVQHNIYADYDGTNYLDGYLADVNFIDGQALTPSSFGETDTITGVWKPKAYTGTYGTNGFYLKFSDIATTSGSNAGLGKDFSGNSNYWTTNNISVTSGTTYDAMTDSPTNTSATVANYCTLNPLIVPKVASPAVAVINEGNLAVYNSGASNWLAVGSTIGVTSGKWYWEVTPVGTLNGVAIGIHKSDTYFGSAIVGYSGDPDGYAYLENGNKVNNSTGTAYGATYASGDVIGVALDMDAGTLTYYKNNTSQGTAFTGLSGSFMPASSVAQSCTLYHNFGQRPFAYTPPTGYLALNTFNLPNPTILQGNKYMDATLWTGNGTVSGVSQTITNASAFKPDFVWVKSRSNAYQNALQDSVRGAGKTLFSALTNAEAGNSGDLITSFNSNGFTVNTTYLGGFNETTNNSGSTYVGWQWQAGQGSTSSNTAGSITSTVSVNTTAGFSVVTYTGTGANATVGHGLGVAPAMVIVKRRNSTGNWNVRHVSITAANSLYLNLTNASQSDPTVWNSTVPTSTVFSIGTDTGVNASGGTYVGYCWAEIAGFSRFGSYTGNGSTDGPFVATNFKPKFVMIKVTSTTNVWLLIDATRNPYNVANFNLNANDSSAENTASTGAWLDFTSNGFKIRNGSDSAINSNGATYVYACFASHPFKNSNAV